MDTTAFLERVLPPDGIFVAAEIAGGKMRHRFVHRADDVATLSLATSRRGYDAYYGISSFNVEQRRKADVRQTKALIIDVDCGEGKPYPDWKEGLKATAAFVDGRGLPKPMVVFSGNGLHIYWILDEALSPQRWAPLSEALKNAATMCDFRIDAGLTTNSAVILRPPGTINTKNGNTVRVLVEGDITSSACLESCLKQFMVPDATTPNLVPTGVGRADPLTENIMVMPEFDPTDPVKVYQRCGQVRWAVDNQHEVKEPFWYALLGVAAFCQDPETTAVSWSHKHPSFDAATTRAKLTQWAAAVTGPTTCERFEMERAGGCKGCKYKNFVSTPNQTARSFATTGFQSKPLRDLANHVPLPRSYKRTKTGIKQTIQGADVDVLPFDIYPVSYGPDESLGYEVVKYHWDRPHIGWVELSFRNAHLVDGSREFGGMMADNGITIEGNSETIKRVQMFMRRYMKSLQNVKEMTTLYNTMGWKEDRTRFVIGDSVISKNKRGEVVEEHTPLASSSQRFGRDFYERAGDLSSWTTVTGVLQDRQLYAQMFVLNVGFSAPLYAFTGLKGLTISLFGETGSGKTLAQLWAQSIYGNPERLHFTSQYTSNSLFNRLGSYAHLPMTIDELSAMDHREVDDFLFSIPQGREKIRLDRNAEEKESKEWAAPVIVSTNVSLQSKLAASGHDSDAQMMRLLEVPVPAAKVFRDGSDFGRGVHEILHKCHGHAGREYIKRLVGLGHDEIVKRIGEANERFAADYLHSFVGKERYWRQAIILSDLAGALAMEWGLIDYDPKDGTRWVLSQLSNIRQLVKEATLDAYDLLAEYVAANAGATIVVLYNNKVASYDEKRLPRGEVRIRISIHEGGGKDHGVMLFDRQHFRKWLATRSGDFKVFEAQMQVDLVDATPRSGKATMGKDTPIKLPQVRVIGFNLNHERLRSMLLDNPELIAVAGGRDDAPPAYGEA